MRRHSITQLILSATLLCNAPCLARAPAKPKPKKAPAKETKSADDRSFGYQDVYPGLRLAMGPLWDLSRSPAITYFSLDVNVNAMLIFSWNKAVPRRRRIPIYQGLYLTPELGYSYDMRHLHLATVGLGFGFRDVIFGVHYVPRFVGGSGRDGPALGIRHGLVLDLLLAVFTLELAHQVVWVRRTPRHDLRVLLGFDAVRAFFIMYKALSR